MTLLHEVQCANCGAVLRVMALRGSVVLCEYCGNSFRLPASPTPEPELGDLLLGCDFRDQALPGWTLMRTEQVEFRPGTPAELWTSFEPSNLIHPVLRTPGPFDDFDLAVTIRFIRGALDAASAGFELRVCDAGDYVVRLSAQGTFSVGWHDGNQWGGSIIPWSEHNALRGQWGMPNRLRVLLRGDQLRLYLNGVIAASVRDARFRMGTARLVATPSQKEPLTVAFSDLQLRDV